MLRKLIITLLMALIIPSFVFAGSDQTQDHSALGGIHKLEISWTAHTDGTYTSFPTRAINGVIMGVLTDPGSTAPQTLYDITLKNTYGLDIMGGALADRSATVTEYIEPYNATQNTYRSMPNHGALTLAISNIVTNAGTGKVVIYYFAK